MNEEEKLPEQEKGTAKKKPMSKKKKIVLFVLIALLAAGPIAAGIIIFCNVKESKNIFEQHYDDLVARFREENGTAKDIDVVFLGDSITELCDVNKWYPEYKTLNRGIGGDTTDGVLERLDVSVYDVHPKVVVMLIGVNNIYKMMDNYEQILQSFRENAPDTKIVLESLTPMSGSFAIRNAKAVENNKQIAALAEKYGYIYIDVYSALSDEETGEAREGFTVEGLHLSDDGYAIATAKIGAVLAELLKTG